MQCGWIAKASSTRAKERATEEIAQWQDKRVKGKAVRDEGVEGVKGIKGDEGDEGDG